MKLIAGLLLVFLLSVQGNALADVDIDDIKLPRGFEIEVYANVPNARSLALGYNGVVFVSNRRGSSIYAVVPSGDANPQVIEVARNLDMPNGIAFHNADLYVAEVGRILVYRNVMARLTQLPAPEVFNIQLPGERHHGWRYISFGPDGKLYVGVGAPCNICDRDDEGFGQIWRVNEDGSELETYAYGVRNTVGFTWHPETNDLWFTDNGRDMMGDNVPPCELNHAPQAGMHFGYPFCHGSDVPDPDFGEGRNCADYVAPAQELGPHVAPLGVKFYTGEMFPPEYHGQVFIAEHGSWNRSKKIGYRIMMVSLEDGMPESYKPFAQGWLKGQKISGRPVDLLVMPDGSMLVSDDHADVVYRIYYEG